MKMKILFLAIFTIGIASAQDYYPFSLGNEWIYNILDSEKNVIGWDTARCEEVIPSGDTVFYIVNNYIDYISDPDEQTATTFYNGISDPNEIYRKATNKLLFFKHQYTDGESYGNIFFSFTSNLIGDYVIGTDTFPDCYYLKVDLADSTGFIAAPDVGLIGAIEDSVLIRELKIQKLAYLIKDSLRICDGDSAMIYSEYRKDAGVYTDSLLTIAGRDSILVTKLIVDPVYEMNVNMTICDNEFYFAGGENQNTAGIYYDTLSTIYGCDSVIITDLSVNPIQRSISNVSICEGETYFAGGEHQASSGEYYDTLSTVLGCDSIIITNLSVKSASANTVDVEICEGESHFAGGAMQTASGTYYDTLAAANGCDSVLTTNLSVLVCSDALAETGAGTVIVYPNPSSGIVYIRAENIVRTRLYDATGKLLLETEKSYLNISDFAGGRYYLRCYTSETEYVVSELVYRK